MGPISTSRVAVTGRARFGVVLMAGIILAGCTTTTDVEWTVDILYESSWSGTVGAEGEQRSVDGTGNASYTVTGTVASANAQKEDDSARELTIQLVAEGEVIEQTSTTAEYGVAQVSASASDV